MFIKDEVEVIRQWIAMGAHAPKDEKPEPDPKEHWAYQPIERPALPYSTENQNPVDAFINFKCNRDFNLNLRPIEKFYYAASIWI